MARCEECRDPGHIPRAVEVCTICAPLYYAREALADAWMGYAHASGAGAIDARHKLTEAGDELLRVEAMVKAHQGEWERLAKARRSSRSVGSK